MLTDGQGRALVLLLTAGNVNDCPTFPQRIDGLRVPKPGPGRPRTRPDYVLGDKGYSSPGRCPTHRGTVARSSPFPLTLSILACSARSARERAWRQRPEQVRARFRARTSTKIIRSHGHDLR
jgi:hypothetical protein